MCNLNILCIYLIKWRNNSIRSILYYLIIANLHDGCHYWSRNCYSSGAPELTPVFSKVRVIRSSVLNVFWRSLFALLHFFFWPLCCLFFDIRIWIHLWYLQTLLNYILHASRIFIFNRRSSANEINTREQNFVDITRHIVVHSLLVLL